MSSEAATTARTSSVGRNRPNGTSTFGRTNMAFDPAAADDATTATLPAVISPTNDNVTFREKKEFGRPMHNGNGLTTFNRKDVEVTTEL